MFPIMVSRETVSHHTCFFHCYNFPSLGMGNIFPSNRLFSYMKRKVTYLHSEEVFRETQTYFELFLIFGFYFGAPPLNKTLKSRKNSQYVFVFSRHTSPNDVNNYFTAKSYFECNLLRVEHIFVCCK